MKQQFVRKQPSRLDNGSQQEIPAEEPLSGKAQTRPASTQGSTPPTPQDAIEVKSSLSWAEEETVQIEARQVSMSVDGQVPPVSQLPVQQPPTSVPYPVYGPPTHPEMTSQWDQPTQLNTPVLRHAPYGPPTPPEMASGQNQLHTPIRQTPYHPSTQPGAPPYGPSTQPGMPLGQHPATNPVLPYNASFTQRPAGEAEKALRKKRRFPIWARVLVVFVAVCIVGGGTAFGYYQMNFANPLGKITGQQAAQIGMDGQSTTDNGVGAKRFNILLLGSDTDGKNTSPLAQTDIVITIDPQTNYVGMLSIPRDLRVVIPDEGTGKMDAAFSFGWQGNFGGATALANAAGLSIATVEKNFGIPINYYAWVGLDGFVKVINTAGGVDIDATHPIVDNAYPNDVNSTNPFAYQRLYIVPGPQHMDGIQALDYVRSRHADLVGDFGRSARQQQILSQLKTKLDTPDIITKLPELANDLGDTVKTNMSVQDIVNFMNFAHNIDTGKVDRLILSPPYSSQATDTTGDYLPNCSLIIPKIAQMFDLANSANCLSTGSVNPGNTVLATHQPDAHISASAVSTMALSNSTSLATQFLSQLQPIQPTQENVTGVRSLLDLLFLVVFGSLDATKI